MTGLISWNGWKILPDNIPQARPGAYCFKNLLKPEDEGYYHGISGIRSGVAGRCKGHPNGARKFKNAVNKYGKENFLLTPIYYLFDAEADTDNKFNLQALEADLIKIHDSVRRGYNIKEADGGVGPCGPEFSKILRESLAVLMQDPEFRERRSASSRRGCFTIHAQKDADGKSINARRANLVSQVKRSIEEKSTTARRAGLAATVEKDADGKSTNARRHAFIVNAKKDVDGKSIGARRGGLAANAEKDDSGKSINAQLRGLAAHVEKDTFGRSLLILKVNHIRWHVCRARFNTICPFCNPDGYEEAYRLAKL